jgi:AhpD family alkylhydroperoxidase
MIRHVQPVSRRFAGGVTARVYEEMRREFGLHAEPIVLHSPNRELLAGAWMLCRETLVAAGVVDRAVKEAVATAVSSINHCSFCVDAHAVMLAGCGRLRAASRLERGVLDDGGDPELREAVEWAAATRSPGADVLRKPPFGEREAPEMIGTALFFHYINRPVSVFGGERPLAAARGRLALHVMLWVAARRFRRFTQARPPQGATLDLLPDAEPPAGFDWTRGSPALASAWGRFTAAVERAGAQALAPEVRGRVLDVLGDWDGADPGLGTDWVERGLDGLAHQDRPAAGLALRAALAPYRVDERVVRAFREGLGATRETGDAALVGAVSWAGLAAARRIGSWLEAPKTAVKPSGPDP